MQSSSSVTGIGGDNGRNSHALTFAKVLDGRKQPICGLWIRNHRYYAQLTGENSVTGLKKVKRVPLVDKEAKSVATVAQAIAEMGRLKVQRAGQNLPTLRRTPRLSEYVKSHLDFIRAGQGTKKAGSIAKANRRWPIGLSMSVNCGWTNRWQEQFGYAYDAAGNLHFRTNYVLVQGFNVNSLNELTSTTNAGRLTVAGTTTSPATNVTVNTSNAMLYADVTFATTNQPWVSGNNTFTAIAKDVYGRRDTNSITVNLQVTNNFAYDLNGNLLSDGRRGFDYDDENQLIRVTVTNSWKSEFTYDGRMRRRISKEFTWNGSSWLQTNEVHFIYDGNLVVQERDTNNQPLVTYTRGNDLSGTLQGAGGIGGLLARTDNGQLIGGVTFAHAYYHADGNGNVTCLIYTSQMIAAKYLYDPFGNILSQSGSLADANGYRFSSKEWNGNMGFYYFGRRYYDPNLQRWLNRDPMGERGGLNLYGYAYNDPVNNVDTDGLSVIGKVIPKVIKFSKWLIKGERAVKATSVDDAVRLYKEGESFVMCPTKDAAKEAARKANNGSPPIHEIDKKTGSPHYHPNDRSGHFLYGIAGALTFSHYAVEGNPYSETAGGWLDLINPLSIGQDILDIKDTILE